ncbi:MAG: sugar O-acetyltransferase [Duncaniella sp.]|nr:sugar O-acetyltransferase [Duncaniella sp.]
MKLIENLHKGKWVYGFDDEIHRMLLENEERCFELNSLSPLRVEERKAIIRNIFGSIGEPFTLHSPFHCDFGKHIHIGHNFTGNFNLTILDEGVVTIGDNVFIGPNCGIYTINHALLPEQRNVGVMRARPVTIGDNVWLGANVTVLPGVTVGEGCVIGAGSVVTGDLPPFSLCVGNPCRVIRRITEADRVTPVED